MAAMDILMTTDTRMVERGRDMFMICLLVGYNFYVFLFEVPSTLSS